MEDSPVYGKHEWATCVCHGRDVLCCLTIAGARFDETVGCGCARGCCCGGSGDCHCDDEGQSAGDVLELYEQRAKVTEKLKRHVVSDRKEIATTSHSPSSSSKSHRASSASCSSRKAKFAPATSAFYYNIATPLFRIFS
jgi:hypothetical protein